MLKQLDVTTRRGTSLVLPMVKNNSGYQIADIEGLDPVKANLVSTSFPTMDGVQFQSARRGARNIKIKFDLQPDWTTNDFASLRLNLYKYLLPKSEVTLRFHQTSGLYVDIKGTVEEHTSPSFDQDPKVTVGIMCFKPDFIDPQMVTRSGVTVSTGVNTNIDYPGNVEAGTVITLAVNRSLPAFSIYNRGEDNVLYQLDFSAALIAGDQLVISSLSGSKGITLTRAGVSSSLLYGRSAQSSWIEFQEGVNQFRIYAPGDPVPYQLEYMVRYGGI